MPQEPVSDVYADFLDDERYRGHTRAVAISILNRWDAWITPRRDVLKARAVDLEDHLEERERAGIAPSTRRKDWQIVGAFYAWAARPATPKQRYDRPGGQLIKADPMHSVRPPHVTDRPATRAAKPDEVAAIIATFPRDEWGYRNAAMVSLMFRSGLRVGELPAINAADVVDWGTTGRQVIRLRADDTKTEEPRQVPVHPETQRLLARYLRKRGPLPGPLFMAQTGRAIDPSGRLQTQAIRDVVKRAAERAGVKVSPHQFRRGFVGEYLRASRGDVLGLEVIGGWADHRMPRRYLADEEAAAGVDRFFQVVDAVAEPTDEVARRRRRRA